MDSSDAPSTRPGEATGDFVESAAWTAETQVRAEDIVEKQNLVKDILAAQDGLRALLSRVTSVEQDCSKAESDNEMLQMYIDSVTKSLAAKS